MGPPKKSRKDRSGGDKFGECGAHGKPMNFGVI